MLGLNPEKLSTEKFLKSKNVFDKNSNLTLSKNNEYISINFNFFVFYAEVLTAYVLKNFPPAAGFLPEKFSYPQNLSVCPKFRPLAYVRGGEIPVQGQPLYMIENLFNKWK